MERHRGIRRVFRQTWEIWTLLLLLVSLAASICSQPADSFNPNAYGGVYALAVQTDGRILIGGAFTTIGGQTRSNLARVTSTGSLDPTFNPVAKGAVYCLSVQPDNKILIGGSF